MVHAPERVAAIRKTLAAKIEIVAELEATVKDTPFRKQLQLARNWLEDIENFYLSALNQERTPEAESTWLDYAENSLKVAILQLKSVQDAVAKYGPNVTTIEL
jgi:hypothetical protein